MSEIKALDDLCEWANDCLDSYLHRDAMRIADRIETEVAERYMELPVDADGVPIRYGDSLSYCGEHGEVVTGKVCNMEYRERSYGEADWLVNVAGWIFPGDARHAKPRTIEDVLRDCCNEWNKHCGHDWESGVYAKYATEIREIIGGEK